MKKIYWIILIIIIILLIGYFTNWFGLNKKSNNDNIAQRKSYILQNNQTVTCGPGCTLSTNTNGASQTVTVGNITYTCRCSDGSTSSPIINN